MKKAKFIYVDKQKNIYPFVIPVSNEHSSFISEQAVQLKEIGLTTPKLYDLIAVETFIPRLHHSKPTVIFDQYIEQEVKHLREYDKIILQQENVQSVYIYSNELKEKTITLHQGEDEVLIEKSQIKTLCAILTELEHE